MFYAVLMLDVVVYMVVDGGTPYGYRSTCDIVTCDGEYCYVIGCGGGMVYFMWCVHWCGGCGDLVDVCTGRPGHGV